MMGGLALAIDNRNDDGDDELMLRPAAAKYLSRKLGRPVAVGTLKRWASEGRGPPFTVIMRKATYSRSGMDGWIKEQTSKQ